MGMIVNREGSVPYSGAQATHKCLIQSCDVIEPSDARKKIQTKEGRNRGVNVLSPAAYHHLFTFEADDCIEGQQTYTGLRFK